MPRKKEPQNPVEREQRALSRLRDPEGAALPELARLMVEQATATPMRQLASPRWIAGQLAAALEAGSRGDLLRSWVERRIQSERQRWGDEARPLRAFVPDEADAPLRRVLGRAYAPGENIVLRIVDQPAMRGLVRVVLTDTVTRFRKRVAEWDSGVLGGLGKRAAARGRGLFGNVGRNLSGIAENLVEAVREEVDWALEGRVKDFVASATTEAVRNIANYMADPAHAEQFGEMRIAILDVLLDTPVSELAAESDKLEPGDLVEVIVVAVRSAVGQSDFVDRATERIDALLNEAGDGTFGAWLDEVGLRAVWTETTTELVSDRLRAVVATPEFDGWWSTLFADEAR